MAKTKKMKLWRIPDASEQYPEWAEWGMALHTALRKCCDSRMTSIAYNIINGMQNGEWGAFSQMLLAAIDAKAISAKTPESLAEGIRRMATFDYTEGCPTFTDEYEPKFTSDQRSGKEAEELTKKSSRSLWSALIMVIGEFDEGDMLGFVAYLFREEKKDS